MFDLVIVWFGWVFFALKFVGEVVAGIWWVVCLWSVCDLGLWCCWNSVMDCCIWVFGFLCSACCFVGLLVIVVSCWLIWCMFGVFDWLKRLLGVFGLFWIGFGFTVTF